MSRVRPVCDGTPILGKSAVMAIIFNFTSEGTVGWSAKAEFLEALGRQRRIFLPLIFFRGIG